MRPGSMALVLCDECACGMLTLEEAVAVAQASSREIYRQVEAGTIHFKETSERLLLICLKTLVQSGARRSGSILSPGAVITDKEKNDVE
jgi:hypothetical protein